MMYTRLFKLIFLCLIGLQSFSQEHVNHAREKIGLAGSWKFQLDPANAGLKMNWQDSSFHEVVMLPGSLEGNRKGTYVEQPSNQYLNQTYKYVGAAWYQKEIVIPASWKNKRVELFLERTKVTRVWIDDQLIGYNTLLSAPQVYCLTGKLTPGKHKLTVMVDNNPKLVPVGGSHALSEHTQTNWNGIIGRMYLEAAGNVKVDWVKVTPDVKNRRANVRIRILNSGRSTPMVSVELQASAWNSKATHVIDPLQFKVDLGGSDTIFQFSYPMGDKAVLWSEYNPTLYKLTVSLYNKRCLLDKSIASFGLREFKAEGTQFRNNGIITFLRGKNDVCIFPLTGYPAMDTASWRKLYRIARSYGINHYRFHSYTPPEAAFEAADVEGIYIQAELPIWSNFTEKDTFQTNFQYREGRAIFDAYGNHPSFVMFTLGNELGGDMVVHNKLVKDFRNYDIRRLYAYGTNAFYLDPKPGETDDFWVTMRTGKESPGREFDVRGSFATTEDVGNGMINCKVPSTRTDLSSAIKGMKVPVIGHEIGQYQIYPDYKEIPLYTGVLRPLNFEIFRKRLQDAGMGDQAEDFFKASGMLTALLYREEIEMAFRTPGYAGFQLLDLQDFPGQGTALVGLLNAFMESKGFVSPDEFRWFNNDVVVQLLMDKYTWTNNEIYSANIQLVNYSTESIAGKELTWKIVEEGTNQSIGAGNIPVMHAANGKIIPLGRITHPLQGVSKATKLLVQLEIKGTDCKAEYPLWVYPKTITLDVPANVTVATELDDALLEKLNRGARVLLFPNHEEIKETSVVPQFISEFWNWLVFKGAAKNHNRPVSAGTLGILTRQDHPLFKNFPTEFHTNWQWWTITKNARPLILDNTDKNYRPIVQVIDNIDRNHKLGMIFEFKIGNGRLLVSMADLPALLDKAEARQLYYSMLRYAASDQFNPQHAICAPDLKGLL
jgi:hypothetical protein